ncbi:MAG: hydrogenase maturation nickel metallochaperone HypA [Lachnospiraceae bacterium]|nr:hydrogenase maturation nickel metallochaperone HypA [Lachnospiraceae bacterium]
MHELPAVTEIINTLDEESRKNGLSRIKKVDFIIGELSSIEEECVRSYFELLSQGRTSEGAELEFTKAYARLRCPKCGREFEHSRGFDCPECGSGGILIKGTGREFVIKEITGE